MESTDQEKNIPRKPIQVTYAFYLLVVSGSLNILLGIMYAILYWQERFIDRTVFTLTCWGLLYVIPFWIAFKINSGRNWARWFLAASFVISLIEIPGQLREFGDYPIQTTLSLISLALVSIAVFLLFQRPADVWFKVITIGESTPEQPRLG